MNALEHASVAADYLHAEKFARAEPSLALGDTILKWYDVAPDEAPVPLAVRAVARRCLRDACRSDELGVLGALGFVILHRCGADFYFLLVCTWRNENELWETVWAKNGESDVLFRPWPIEGTHRPTFCVWELGAVAHEREAWTRYLQSERDETARRAYLGDTYAGIV
jgi:hypothetical protein